jgi:hypothetical protein
MLTNTWNPAKSVREALAGVAIRKGTIRGAIAVAALCAGITAALAGTFPIKVHREQEIDRHQVGWIDVTIQDSGKVVVAGGFSNGKQLAGNNFYGITSFVRKDGSVIHNVLQEKGLDGSWGGHAREGRVTNEFTMTPEQLAEFDHITYRAGVRNCGMKVVEMHNLNDWTFSTDKCTPPAITQPSPSRELRSGQK